MSKGLKIMNDVAVEMSKPPKKKKKMPAKEGSPAEESLEAPDMEAKEDAPSKGFPFKKKK